MTSDYAAGFFDGEGCVYIYRSILHIKIGGAFVPGTLDRFKEKWGGHISNPYINKNKKYKDRITWTLTGLPALKFLEDIYPFVFERKSQIELGIRFQKIKISSVLAKRPHKRKTTFKNFYAKHDPESCELLKSIQCNLRALKKIKYDYSKAS